MVRIDSYVVTVVFGLLSSVNQVTSQTTTEKPTTVSQARGQYNQCATGWFQYTTNCYLMNRNKFIWTGAKDNCRKQNATLVSIHSQEENDFIISQLRRNSQYWIGLGDWKRDKTILWQDNSTLIYTNWLADVPFKDMPGYCAYIDGMIKKWLFKSCLATFTGGFICKRPAAPVNSLTIGCNEGGYAYNDTCYTLYNETKSWNEAQKFCQLKSGNLINFSNRQTTDLIQLVFEADNLTFWMAPAGNSTGNECAASKYLQWTSYDCNDTLPFFCETQRQESNSQLTTSMSRTTSVARTTRVTTSPLPPCPSNWIQKNDFCYKVLVKEKNWYEARHHCETLGGNLPSIHDTFQNKKFSEILELLNLKSIWIGLHDVSVEKDFEWSDGSNFDFSQWNIGEPNSFTVSEDCVELFKDGKWNDNNCNIILPYFCVITRGSPTVPPPVSTTPAPTCPEKGWVFHGGFCYYISDDEKSWRRARSYCLSKAGELASIHSEDENNFLLNQLSIKKYFGFYWIGLSKMNKDNFVWSDGKPTLYEAWSAENLREDTSSNMCVSMKSEHARWYRTICKSELKYICKKSNDSLTTPVPPTTTNIQGVCPDGFYGKDIVNKCYYIGGSDDKEKLTWMEARDACSAMSSTYNVQLASINSHIEQAIVTLLAHDVNANIWIGLNDYEQYGEYSWLDESDPKYTNWAPGEPRRTLHYYDDPYYYMDVSEKIKCFKINYKIN